jgi:hypothetical protein
LFYHPFSILTPFQNFNFKNIFLIEKFKYNAS